VSTTLANQFIEDGHQVTIASYKQPLHEAPQLNLSEQCDLLFLSHPVLSIKNIKKLREYILSHQIEVLINQWVVPFYATMVWKIATHGTNCQVYSVHHNPPDTNMRIQSLKRQIELGKGYLKGVYDLVREVSRLSLAFCIKNSHQFILLSPSFIPIAQKFSRVKLPTKFLAIPNPIPMSVSDEDVSKEKEIIYVGRIEYNQKRTDRVVDIWRELEPRYPDWKLTIVGDGDDRDDLEKRIDEYGLKRVVITGFVNPIEYYKRASILLLTSEYEGFGLVVAEAMSQGVVPVVYNSFESAHDLVTDGYNGALIEKSFSVQTFTKVMYGLMANADYRNTLSKNGKITSEKYLVDCIVKEWYQLIDN
jgi:glycosyltransferase involved in cell wall biosynthesis